MGGEVVDTTAPQPRERCGEVRLCQGQVLADWRARTADGKEVSVGTNLFVFDPDGRISDVTGFWSATPARPGG